MSSDEEIYRKIVKDFYGKRYNDLLDPEKCEGLLARLETEKTSLGSKLDITNGNSPIGKVVLETEILINKCKDIAIDSQELVSEIENDLERVDEVRKEIQNKFDKLNELQTILQYVKVIQKIEYFNIQLERDFKKKDDELCVTIFANLCEIDWNLIDFSGHHLKKYLRDCLKHWHNVLKEKLANDFDDVLKTMKWPFINRNVIVPAPSQTVIQKLQIITEYLLQIEMPSDNLKTVISPDEAILCLPVDLLVQPLRKRFLYHFYGLRQTNRIDKPEWYFTQVLTWIRDHKEFVRSWVQPVVNKLGLHHIDAELQLTRGLVQLAVDKLNLDLKEAQFDDSTFSHCIEEALAFDKELRDAYSYPQHQISVLSILTQGPMFVKWMHMERKFAIEKMDEILSSTHSDPFEVLSSDIEELKITTCADAFITLLQTITDRYEALPQPGHRIQFLDLQLEILDDFRVRLIQITNVEGGDIIESKVSSIVNTLYYIENVLVDWGNMLHFLSLFHYKTQLENVKNGGSVASSSDLGDIPILEFETETVFAETLSLYSHMRKDLLCTLSEFVIMEVKSKSKPYRRERWSSMKTEKEFKSLSLTPSACPIFEVIAKRLHQLQKKLADKLFTTVWRSIASHLDTFLFEDLVLDSRFNDGGALQLKYDIIRNLMPLFAQFSEKPEVYFTQLIEAINLLTMTKGSALLLRETLQLLEGATGVEDTRGRTLKDVGVNSFTPKMAVTILNQRSDVTVNRLQQID